MKTFGRSKIVYVLHDSYQDKQRQLIIQHRQFINYFATALIPLAAAVGLFFISAVGATPPPLILGELPYQKYDTHALTSQASLGINIANGNLILQTKEFNISGTGPALSINRYFNDMATGSGQLGSHNTLSVGNDVHITANANGSATYQGPSGFQVVFPSNGSGGYTLPASYTGATLAPVTGGGWTLTFHQTGEVYTFNNAGNQTKDASADGEAIIYAYNSNGTLNTATDAQGRVT